MMKQVFIAGVGFMTLLVQVICNFVSARFVSLLHQRVKKSLELVYTFQSIINVFSTQISTADMTSERQLIR